MTQPSDYFERAKALQAMILEAQEDLKQLRADAIEELIPEGTPKNAAKETRADLGEVFALAKIAAKGDMEEKKQAEKLARRKRIAEECGVQLDLLPTAPDAAAVVAAAEVLPLPDAPEAGPDEEDEGHNGEHPQYYDEDDDRVAQHDPEPATMHAGSSNPDYDALGNIPEFLRRS